MLFKINLNSVLFFLVFFICISCDLPIEDEIIKPYAVGDINENAGQWKTYLNIDFSELKITSPKDIQSVEYKLELTKLLDSTKNLSKEKKQIIDFWGAGAVYRWNEIGRELAAKYNLAPVANTDGTYPVPDPLNPLKEPKFPFSNPPYTARAMAYLSVSQYDALVATWYFKYKFKRPAPHSTDNRITALLPLSNLPTYPSEDAVVAGASFTILSAMFPGEVTYLKRKLEESKNSRMWAGMNVESDIVDGEEIGVDIAKRALVLAKNDGMSEANKQSLVVSQIESAKSKGMVKLWESLEKPVRPPMLPNYGSLKTWNLSKQEMIYLRPKLPPLYKSKEWQTDFEELQKINKSQTREQAKIANYWADGGGSYTPPGHWHRIAANLCREYKLSEVNTARNLALMGTSLMDAGIACWDTKFSYYSPRPQQFGLKTSVGLPNFPSYTSGHSTFSSAGATVLSYIFPEKAAELNEMALEASNSRIYGLIHFRVDCEMGLEHGKRIGEYAIIRGKNDKSAL